MPYPRRLLLTCLLALTLGPVLQRFALLPYASAAAALLHGFNAYDDAYLSLHPQAAPRGAWPDRLLSALLAAALGAGATASGALLPTVQHAALLSVPALSLLSASLALLSLSAAPLLRLRPH